ncbi:hypothetical protein ACFX2G_036736 [Malus domestica]
MRKLLEFDFFAAMDGAVNDRAVKIGAAEDEVFDKRTIKCKSGCCLVDLQAFDLLSYVTFSHYRAYPGGCREISLPFRTGDQLVYLGCREISLPFRTGDQLIYLLALDSLPLWVSGNWFTLSHWRAISLTSRTGEQTLLGVGKLVYPIAPESN